MQAPSSHKDGRSARELSPWSARRAMTLKMNEERNQPRLRSRSRSRSRSRDRRTKNGSTRGARTETATPRHPSRSKSRGRRRDPSRDRRPKGPKEPEQTSPAPHAERDASPADRNRDSSPEPYRKPRAPSRETKRERSGDSRDGSTERKRPRSRERRDRSEDSKRNRSRDRRDRSRDRHRERSRDRKRTRSRDRHRKRSKDRYRDRSRSPLPYRSRKRRSASPTSSPDPPKRRRRSPSPLRRSKKPLPSQEVSFRGLDDSTQPPSKYGGAPPEKERPNFRTTGLLAKAANKIEGTKISLKYHEPPEARKPPPSSPWRMFVFKGEDVLDTVELHTRSCWLLGRAHEVADIVLEHPSSSQQHAAIQFRYIQKTVEDEFGVRQRKGKVKPYIIDLESSNGTELNGRRIETSRYFELRDKDILKFAGSEREYVIMLPPPEA